MAFYWELEDGSGFWHLEDGSGNWLLENQSAVTAKPRRGRRLARFLLPQRNVIKIPHFFQFSFSLFKPIQRKTIRERVLSGVVSIPVVKQVTKMVAPKLAVRIQESKLKTVVNIPSERIHLEIYQIPITVTRIHETGTLLRFNDTALTNDPLVDAIIMNDDVALADAIEKEET